MSGLRIKQICTSKGITIKQLAEKMDLKPESLSRSLSGNPTLSTLLGIADALNVDISDLFEKQKSICGHIEYEGEIYSIKTISDLDYAYKHITELNNSNQ